MKNFIVDLMGNWKSAWTLRDTKGEQKNDLEAWDTGSIHSLNWKD